jgi:hypothetical protein
LQKKVDKLEKEYQLESDLVEALGKVLQKYDTELDEQLEEVTEVMEDRIHMVTLALERASNTFTYGD